MSEENQLPRLRLDSGAAKILLLVVSMVTLFMFGYCMLVAARGISTELFFFNFVELFPLALMVIAFWVSRIFRPRKK